MQITIKEATLSNNQPLTLNVDKSSTILEIKKQIQLYKQIPVAQQQLVFNGKLLEDEKSLSYYSIENGTILQLILKYGYGPPSILYCVFRGHIKVEPVIDTYKYFSGSNKRNTIPRIVQIEQEWPQDKPLTIYLYSKMFLELKSKYINDEETLNPNAIEYYENGLIISVSKLKSDKNWKCLVNFLRREIQGSKLFFADFDDDKVCFIPGENGFTPGSR